ncbi:MAG: SPASM domain-containing protein [Gemmatimonadota bacterium]|nr:MAG: SPASM domain-containing protein [Gemmatimonadota bacterium]
MFPSKYTNTIDIRDFDCDYDYVVYNSLTGYVSMIDRTCYDIVKEVENDSSAGGHISKLDEGRSTFLTSRGYILRHAQQDTDTLIKLTSFIETLKNSYEQFSIVFYPAEKDSACAQEKLTAIFNTIATLATSKNLERYFFHFWAFHDIETLLFEASVRMLKNVIDQELALRQCEKLYITLHSNGVENLNFHQLTPLNTSKVLKIFVDCSIVKEFHHPNDYVSRVKDTIKQAAEVGFETRLYFIITEENKTFVLNDLLDRFVVGGLFPWTIYRFYVLPFKEERHKARIMCDMNVTHWSSLGSLIRDMAETPKYHLTSLFGGGVISKFQFLLNNRERLLPDVYYCPYIQNSYVFDLDGNIFSCPEACYAREQPEHTRVGTYIPKLMVKKKRLHVWRDRKVTELKKCMDCCDAFICAGGCPYESLRAKGNPYETECQPVSKILRTGIAAHLNSFLSDFGPR